MTAITTIPQAAKYAGCSISTIAKGLRNGILIRGSDGAFNPEQLKTALVAQASRRGGRQLSDLGGMPLVLVALKEKQAKEDLRLTIAKRKQAERALGLDDGSLSDTKTIYNAWARLLINFKDELLNVPNDVAGRCELRSAQEIAEIIRTRLNQVLQSLADGGERNGLGPKKPKEPK